MRNKRLLKISDIFENNIIYDVGSDHGYLVKHLFDNHKIDKAHVIEINEDPLENARTTLSDYTNVEYYLSDGLTEVPEIESNSGVVIAGMGGKLISQLVERDYNKLKDSILYLQPNNREETVRKTVNSLGLKIINEYVCFDSNKYYFILKVQAGEQQITETQLILGVNPVINDDYNNLMKENLKYYTDLVAEIKENNKTNNNIFNKYKIIRNYVGELNEN